MTWFGSVPEHWSTPPVYARYEVQLGKMLDERQITKRFLAPYLRNTDVQWDGINVDDLPEMDFDESEQKLYALRPGDILMCEGGEIGRCAIWDSDRRCFYQKALHRLRPTTHKDDPRYFVLVMRAAVEAGLFSSRASAATIQHLPAEKVRVVRYPAPPIEEQRAIVDSVSRQTARLDALVAAKQRVLDLLAEKRKAIIATAVTRGLDLKVELRDSAVPWLGETPSHWEVRRVRTISEFITSGPRGWSERVADEGSLFIQSGDLNDSLQVEFETAKRVSVDNDAEAARTKLQDGDIVVCITGAKTGNVAVCAYVPEPAYVNQHLCLVRPKADVLPVFLGLALKSSVGQRQFSIFQYGLKQGLNLENVREVVIALPPLDEQRAVVEHIARETAKLDAVRAATERTIALLKERRVALIAAAVTGQLDVGAAA